MDTSSAMRAYSGQGPFQDQIKSLNSSEVSPNALARAHEEVPLGGPGLLTQALHNSMNADQLNLVYRQHNLGGDASSSNAIAGALARTSDEAFRTPSLAAATQSLADAAPKSPDAPAVQNLSSVVPGAPADPHLAALQQQWERRWPSPGNGPAVYRGGGLTDQDYALSEAIARQKSVNAHMMGAQTGAWSARNPYGDLSDPVTLQAADTHLQAGGNLVGTAQAHGRGLGPGGAINPQGMKTYFQSKHPEFANLIGNKDATLDNFRDIYNQTRSRFAEGDAQLAEINNSLGQALRFMFSPEEMDRQSRPGWWNWGADGALANQQFLHNTGLR